jgi:hypothetical protein
MLIALLLAVSVSATATGFEGPELSSLSGELRPGGYRRLA